MKKETDKETEDFLKTFSLKPASQGLKEKILDSTIQKKKTNHVMTVFLWKGFVSCLFLMIIVIAVDATVSHSQKNRFSSFLDKPQESSDKQEEEWSMLKEIIWDPLDEQANTVKKKYYGLQGKSKKNTRQLKWRESLEKELE
jgi:hypothetical protein